LAKDKEEWKDEKPKNRGQRGPTGENKRRVGNKNGFRYFFLEICKTVEGWVWISARCPFLRYIVRRSVSAD
jgi:hypothetical protein